MGSRLIPGGGNDVVMTPDTLALNVVKHFRSQISGRVLEPAAGEGAFLRAFANCGILNVVECEITRGCDFFQFCDCVDWIITNPPWSKARSFAAHAYTISNNVIFLINVGAFLGFRARLRDMREASFGLREILYCETPPAPWPQSGFQLGAIHFQRNWQGPIDISWLS